MQPLDKSPGGHHVSKREHAFIFYLLQNLRPVNAARKAGYTEAQATRRANYWIKSTREESEKPHLWDIYRRELDRQLRINDLDAQKIIREIAQVAFASIDMFMDLPSMQDAIDEQARDAETRAFMGIANEEDLALIAENNRIHEHEPRVQRAWRKYRAGNMVKFKAIENIPREAMVAIQSIKETKDGIEVKLHPKMDALDKLCRILQILPKEGDEQTETIDREINIIVKDSRRALELPQSP